MKGRKPKPTTLKLLNGNPGKRAIQRDEPQPGPLVDLAAPERLGLAEAQLWERLAPSLVRLGVATEQDSLALELLCRAWGDYLRAIAALEAAGGETYETQGQAGLMIRQHPAVAMRNDAWRRVLQASAEFGLTPSSRSRVAGAGSAPVDPFEEFLAGRA